MSDDLNPNNTIRSDLWPTMSTSELIRQQELVTNQIGKLLNMMGSATPSLINMYGALQQASTDLAKLIETQSERKL